MQIEFDGVTRDKTQTEHGLNFAHAGEVFAGLHFTDSPARQDYEEDHFITVACWMLAQWFWSGRRAARCAALSA